MKKSIGVLYSGGVDSAALVGHLARKGFEVWPVYVSCGLPWESAEKYWSHRFLRALRSRRVKPLKSIRLLLENAYQKNWSQTGKTPGAGSADEEVYLPARNLLLITKALLWLSSKDVWRIALATLKGNPFPDARPSYFRSFQKLLSQSFLHPIKIEAPFRSSTKNMILCANKNLPLHLSFSCINPKGLLHCGVCNKCAERRRAFKLAGLIDKTIYKSRLN